MTQILGSNGQRVVPKDEVPPKTFGVLYDRVACHIHIPASTAGGLALPDGAQSPAQSPQATVISVGPECKYVKEGDKIVLHHKIHAVGIVDNGKVYTIIKEEDVAGLYPTE